MSDRTHRITTKILFWCSLSLLAACVGLYIFRFFDPGFHSRLITVLNIVTPAFVLAYIGMVIKRRINIRKKIAEYVHKIFSKN